MFGNGREDTTMKHVVLTALGFVLSFVVSVVCNPFAAWLLPVGTYLGDFRALLTSNRLFNIFSISLAPLVLLAYTIFAGRTCKAEREAQQMRTLLVAGIIVGTIMLTYYFFNTLGMVQDGYYITRQVGNFFTGIAYFILMALFIAWCVLPIVVGLPFGKSLVQEQVLWIKALGVIYFLTIVISTIVSAS